MKDDILSPLMKIHKMEHGNHLVKFYPDLTALSEVRRLPERMVSSTRCR